MNNIDSKTDLKIIKLYTDGYSSIKIGKNLKIPSSTVRYRLVKNGILLRDKNSSHRPHVNDNDIIESYTAKALKPIQIAKKFKISSVAVRNILKKHEVFVPIKAPAKLTNNKQKLIVKAYTLQNATIKQLTKTYNASAKTIKSILKKHDVKIKSFNKKRTERFIAHQDPIGKMQNFAKNKNGKCLSKTYKNAHSKLTFVCENNHNFQVSSNQILTKKTWCPKCNINLMEETARAIFELMYGAEFPSSRPKWLKNDTGNQLELDGFCQKLKIAFEYNGKQHYDFVAYFHKNKNSLQQIKNNDNVKIKKCARKNILLLIIPYTENTPLKIFEFISSKLQKSCNIQIDNLSIKNSKLNDIKNICTERNLTLLTKSYLGAHYKYSMICNECKHLFSAILKDFKKCPKCQKLNRLSNDEKNKIHKMQKKGLTCYRISKELNRSISTILRYFKATELAPNTSKYQNTIAWKK